MQSCLPYFRKQSVRRSLRADRKRALLAVLQEAGSAFAFRTAPNSSAVSARQESRLMATSPTLTALRREIIAAALMISVVFSRRCYRSFSVRFFVRVMTERWRPIPGFPLYEVSDRIRSGRLAPLKPSVLFSPHCGEQPRRGK
jgi:hypothetical protein